MIITGPCEPPLVFHSFTLPIKACTFQNSASTLPISYVLSIPNHYLMCIFLYGGIFAKSILFSICVFFMYVNGIVLYIAVSCSATYDP